MQKLYEKGLSKEKEIANSVNQYGSAGADNYYQKALKKTAKVEIVVGETWDAPMKMTVASAPKSKAIAEADDTGDVSMSDDDVDYLGISQTASSVKKRARPAPSASGANLKSQGAASKRQRTQTSAEEALQKQGVLQYEAVLKSRQVLAEADRLVALAIGDDAFSRVTTTVLTRHRDAVVKRLEPKVLQSPPP